MGHRIRYGRASHWDQKNEAWAVKEIRPLEQMSREEMDSVLLEAFLYHKKVSLQLNTKDEFGRYLDSIEGFYW